MFEYPPKWKPMVNKTQNGQKIANMDDMKFAHNMEKNMENMGENFKDKGRKMKNYDEK